MNPANTRCTQLAASHHSLAKGDLKVCIFGDGKIAPRHLKDLVEKFEESLGGLVSQVPLHKDLLLSQPGELPKEPEPLRTKLGLRKPLANLTLPERLALDGNFRVGGAEIMGSVRVE